MVWEWGRSIGQQRSEGRRGNSRVIIAVVLVCLVGVSVQLMSQEQAARDAASTASELLEAVLDSGESLTPETIHEKLGRTPDLTRKPAPHRYVEEYHWQGPMSSYKVYAYYQTGATKLLEAVSLNQTISERETE